MTLPAVSPEASPLTTEKRSFIFSWESQSLNRHEQDRHQASTGKAVLQFNGSKIIAPNQRNLRRVRPGKPAQKSQAWKVSFTFSFLSFFFFFFFISFPLHFISTFLGTKHRLNVWLFTWIYIAPPHPVGFLVFYSGYPNLISHNISPKPETRSKPEQKPTQHAIISVNFNNTKNKYSNNLLIFTRSTVNLLLGQSHNPRQGNTFYLTKLFPWHLHHTLVFVLYTQLLAEIQIILQLCKLVLLASGSPSNFIWDDSFCLWQQKECFHSLL